MQVVNILCNHHHIVILLQFRQKSVPLVGLSIRKLFAQPVVEICNEVGIVIPTLRRGNLLHGIFFPKSARISKGAETALRTHSRSGKDYYLFSFHLADYFIYKDILKIRAVLTTHGIKVVHLRIIIEHSARKRSHAPKADI